MVVLLFMQVKMSIYGSVFELVLIIRTLALTLSIADSVEQVRNRNDAKSVEHHDPDN